MIFLPAFFATAALLFPLPCSAEGSDGTGLLDRSFFTDYKHRTVTIATQPETVRIAYVDALPASNATSRGVILLLHGWPSSSYGFHKIIPMFTKEGYRVIAPDTRGAGNSNKPMILDGYRKTNLAEDFHTLLQTHLNLTQPVNVVGHDIGAMISVAYAGRYLNDTANLVWTEAPIPGSSWFEQYQGSPVVWHFNFHRQPDLPEVLTKGKVREYITFFYESFVANPAGIDPAARDYTASQYEVAGAMRAGANLYRTFDSDAADNQQLVNQTGKIQVRSLSLFGAESPLASAAGQLGEEFFENPQTGLVEGSGHFVAEENAEDFVQKVLMFLQEDANGNGNATRFVR